MASVTRTDDVKKIKGINVFPQAVDDLVFSFAEVDEYRVVLTSSAEHGRHRDRPADAEGRRPTACRSASRGALRDRIGIQFAVEVVDDIERSEYKVRRWHDERVR